MHGIPSIRIWAIEDHVNAFDLTVNETRSLHDHNSLRKIFAAQENINVACATDRRFIGLGDPRPNSVASDDRIRNPGSLKSDSRAFQTLFYLAISSVHALPQCIASEMKCGHLHLPD